jgi:Fe(3+) dicitrate transport protein
MLRLPELGPLSQRLRFGLRLHYDEAVRYHTASAWIMSDGAMIDSGEPRRVTADNSGSATATSAYLVDEIALYGLLLSPGIRFEHVLTDYDDRLGGAPIAGRQLALLPGVSAIYQIIDELAVLAGVHQGFSPVSPGQPDDVVPEVAVNYEGGARFQWEWVGAEAIGFFSDYANLSGECTFSSGCREELLDDQFNGGQAFIYGLEASAAVDIPTPLDHLTVPLTAAYTFTKTEFRSAFSSDNPLWGDVAEGDELPYVPAHQLAATAAVVSEKWGGLSLGATYVGAMFEQAGSGGPLTGVQTDAFVVFDAMAYYQLLEELQLYVKMENIADEQAIVARRPFGARPNRPRFFYGGVKVELDSR